MNKILLGNASSVSWLGRDLYNQSPTQTELSSNNLTTVGGKQTDRYECPEALLNEFMATQLSAGGVSQKKLITVSASHNPSGRYSVTVETQALDYQPEAGTTGGSSGGSGGGGGSTTPTPEQQQKMTNKYGSETQPRILSMTSQEVDVDILKTPDYINLSAAQKAAIKMYIGGASPLTKTTLTGQPGMLQDIIAQSSPLVQKAIASPTIKAINTTIEYSYWALTYTNYDGIFPREADASDIPGDVQLPTGYSAYFLNGSNEPVEFGYRNKEIYLTGYPTFEL